MKPASSNEHEKPNDSPRLVIISVLIVLTTVLLGGCGGGKPTRDSAPEGLPDYSHVPDAVPRMEPYNKAKQRSYTVLGRTYHPLKTAQGFREQGKASWYGNKFHGSKTATGERYDMYAMTAAHKTLPLPCYVEVKNLENGRSIVVRVNDRGPFHDNRIIDLSYAAASKIDMLGKGTALVEIRVIDPENPTAHRENPPSTGHSARHSPRIYIQVGAFTDLDNAHHLKRRLETELKHSVQIESSGHLQKVQVGPLVSIETADSIIDQLEKLNLYGSRMLLR